MTRRLLAACVLCVLVVACSEDENAPPPEGEPAPEGIEGVLALSENTSREHFEDSIEYELRPPVGGPHFPSPAPCQFYGSPEEAPPDELVVHALEHGAVWIAFQADLPPDQQDFIRQATEGSDQVIATPYPNLRAPVVLTAWERQLDLDAIDDPRFEEFISTYLDGPSAPEPGNDC